MMTGPGADDGLSVTKRSDYAIEPIQQSKVSQGKGCKTIASLKDRTSRPFQADHEECTLRSLFNPHTPSTPLMQRVAGIRINR